MRMNASLRAALRKWKIKNNAAFSPAPAQGVARRERAMRNRSGKYREDEEMQKSECRRQNGQKRRRPANVIPAHQMCETKVRRQNAERASEPGGRRCPEMSAMRCACEFEKTNPPQGERQKSECRMQNADKARERATACTQMLLGVTGCYHARELKKRTHP